MCVCDSERTFKIRNGVKIIGRFCAREQAASSLKPKTALPGPPTTFRLKIYDRREICDQERKILIWKFIQKRTIVPAPSSSLSLSLSMKREGVFPTGSQKRRQKSRDILADAVGQCRDLNLWRNKFHL